MTKKIMRRNQQGDEAHTKIRVRKSGTVPKRQQKEEQHPTPDEVMEHLPPLHRAIVKLGRVRDLAKQVKKDDARLKDEVAEHWPHAERTIDVYDPYDGTVVTATWTQPKERIDLDVAGFLGDLTPEQFENCTERVFDQESTERAIAQGIVPREVYARHQTIIYPDGHPRLQRRSK